jgi:transcription termination factor Rho
MRRSTLQRKDRDELTEIATALGRKPGSRARKGEIIDMILDLAAGGDGAVGGDDAAESEPAESEDAATSHEAAASDAGNDDAGNDDSGDDDSGDDDSSDDDSGDDANNAAGSAADGKTEPGNRRRRRRGRDRETRSEGTEAWDGVPSPVEGLLDLRPEGYGFIRVNGLLASRDDTYVPVKLVRQFGLRKGDVVSGPSRPANRNEKNPALISVETVNGGSVEQATDRPEFEHLTPVQPTSLLTLERSADREDLTGRLIDLLAPLGKGQRGLIVAPPRSGKTRLLRDVVRSIETNHPDVHLIVLMVDERPEDVSEFRSALVHGELIASTFDRPADEHIALAEVTVERAKRMVESGRDVVLIVDGITRLVRAYNQEAVPSNRTLAGGLEPAAVYPIKRFLSAARAVAEGGSLTMLSTVLADSGSVLDDTIGEEFFATANQQLRLDQRAAMRRMHPALDVGRTVTNREDLLVDESAGAARQALHSAIGELLDSVGPVGALAALTEQVAATANNDQFLREVASRGLAS